MTPKKVLIVVSDHGFHWDELADAFHVFDDAHWQIDIGSPLGHPKADPLTLRKNLALHLLGRATTKARAPSTGWWGRPVVEHIMRAKRLDRVEAAHYDALFVVGGLHELADLEGDVVLAELLARAMKVGVRVGGDTHVLQSYNHLQRLVGPRPIFRFQNARRTRAAAWKMVEDVVSPEDVHGRTHVAEFLDIKSGR